MNKIIIFYDKNKEWCGFESKGHIIKKNDKEKINLICSALSMHLQTIESSLKKILKKIKVKKKEGFLKIIFKKEKHIEEFQGIKICFLEGIYLLKNSYKNDFIIYNKEI